MKGFLQRVFTKRRETPITYDEAKDMAASPDANVRGVLAQRHDTKPKSCTILQVMRIPRCGVILQQTRQPRYKPTSC